MQHESFRRGGSGCLVGDRPDRSIWRRFGRGCRERGSLGGRGWGRGQDRRCTRASARRAGSRSALNTGAGSRGGVAGGLTAADTGAARAERPTSPSTNPRTQNPRPNAKHQPAPAMRMRMLARTNSPREESDPEGSSVVAWPILRSDKCVNRVARDHPRILRARWPSGSAIGKLGRKSE